ncbi:MAG: arginine--tRNA ligase [Alphaproteobacteria bacterium]|nr:arginine--tRNA ligase [Alphaproteobacteria bacterium]
MNVFNYFSDIVQAEIKALQDAGSLPGELDASRVAVDPPRDAAHGDLACNAAMMLAKAAGMKPRDLAELLAGRLRDHPQIVEVEIAGPGFLNLRLADEFWRDHLRDVLAAGEAYGDSTMGAGAPVNVEYVSANPTGPLHVGHARGAVFGDVLASLLDKAGYAVTREYYINDAGAQIDALARSLHWRYREALGEPMGDMPDGLYPGDYLVPVGKFLVDRDGAKWREVSEDEWLAEFRRTAVDAMMEQIRDDLAALGIAQSVFTSEQSLVAAGRVDDVVETLTSKDLIYRGTLKPPKGKKPDDWEKRPQTLFRASNFGDDSDRPLKKPDGSWTYFASDLAYHLDKYRRGFTTLINVWGADHGGYVKRVAAGVAALTDDEAELDVKLCQLVRLLEDGEVAKMSKRAGTFVTLRELVDAVGRDVVRFIMLTRKNDAQLDFDLVKVREQSRDNPVFYVQYAHARSHSVARMALEAFPDTDFSRDSVRAADLSRLTESSEISLIKTIAAWPRTVEGAAEAHEPHRLAFYLYDLAAAFHALWSKAREDASLRFVVADDLELTRARMALVIGVRTVVASGLRVMGVDPVDELRA